MRFGMDLLELKRDFLWGQNTYDQISNTNVCTKHSSSDEI